MVKHIIYIKNGLFNSFLKSINFLSPDNNRQAEINIPEKIKIPVKVIEVESARGNKKMQTDSKNSNILIKINGEEVFISCNCSILKLLESYQISKDRVVIEINKEILKKDLYSDTIIKEKDEIEIITFAGGG